ncbi:DsbA family protein [Oleisolibacter albus]|uniref:DsbA family protein n=1 Tax=Oleisolibacter albus TaxID=2171757 RepID=UPI001EFD7023|nr:DsbA family protein [Oleisolibacter albus]
MRRFPAPVTALALILTAATAQTGLSRPALAQEKPLDRAAVEAIVRETLVKNPEIILEAIHALEAKDQAASDKAQADALADNRKALTDSPTSPVGGNPKGDVTLVEFFDYNCGYCKRTHPERVEAVKKDGKVRLVYKEFPILAPSSMEAAKAALAAQRQGKYEAMHTALMTHQGKLDTDTIREIAKGVGLDVKKLEDDMGDPAIQKEIQANLDLGPKLGIRGTPGFIVGDTIVPGAIQADQFKQLFAQARDAGKEGAGKDGSKDAKKGG